jgi:hypothetical protein
MEVDQNHANHNQKQPGNRLPWKTLPIKEKAKN